MSSFFNQFTFALILSPDAYNFQKNILYKIKRYYALFMSVKQFIANKHYTFDIKTGLIVGNKGSDYIVHVF